MSETSSQWWEENYDPKWCSEFASGCDESMWKRMVESAGKCAYCGVDGSSDARLLASFHADHLVPVSKGRTKDGINRVFACAFCNTAKGYYDPSHGRGAPRTEEERTQMIADASKYIAERVGSAGKYWRVLHLSIAAHKAN